MRKSGANFTDRNNIRKLNDMGVPVEEIAKELGIQVHAVQNWVDHFDGKEDNDPADPIPPAADPLEEIMDEEEE